MANEHDGGIHSRWMYSIEAQIFRDYGYEELAKMSEEKSKPQNTNTHVYTCLATPPELEQFGLTHMVCRVDTPNRPVAAFNTSAAASMQCDSLNSFCQQDRPELAGPDAAEAELAEANRLAAEREQKTATMSLSEKVAMAQSAVAAK